jgi:hypothetical protein
MAQIITKELAIKIAKTLKAQIVKFKGRPHDLAVIHHEGQVVAQFSIRHGSNKELGHDFIPRDLNISPRNARLLGQCPLKREHYIQLLIERGLIRGPESTG